MKANWDLNNTMSLDKGSRVQKVCMEQRGFRSHWKAVCGEILVRTLNPRNCRQGPQSPRQLKHGLQGRSGALEQRETVRATRASKHRKPVNEFNHHGEEDFAANPTYSSV